MQIPNLLLPQSTEVRPTGLLGGLLGMQGQLAQPLQPLSQQPQQTQLLQPLPQQTQLLQPAQQLGMGMSAEQLAAIRAQMKAEEDAEKERKRIERNAKKQEREEKRFAAYTATLAGNPPPPKQGRPLKPLQVLPGASPLPSACPSASASVASTPHAGSHAGSFGGNVPPHCITIEAHNEYLAKALRDQEEVQRDVYENALAERDESWMHLFEEMREKKTPEEQCQTMLTGAKQIFTAVLSAAIPPILGIFAQQYLGAKRQQMQQQAHQQHLHQAPAQAPAQQLQGQHIQLNPPTLNSTLLPSGLSATPGSLPTTTS